MSTNADPPKSTFFAKPFFAPPSVRPQVAVYEKGIFIVTVEKGQELRGVLIDDEVWVAYFLNEKPFGGAVVCSRGN